MIGLAYPKSGMIAGAILSIRGEITNTICLAEPDSWQAKLAEEQFSEEGCGHLRSNTVINRFR